VKRDAILAWLAAREPAAPERLAERLRAFTLAAPAERLGGTMTQAMSGLGLYALEGSAARGESGDEVAMDLLSADAFVTYAFEAAAEEGADVRQAAADLITRVAP
jgi:hypothetical protein